MPQIKVEQIKVAPSSLIVGSSASGGTELAVGADGTTLHVISGQLGWKFADALYGSAGKALDTSGVDGGSILTLTQATSGDPITIGSDYAGGDIAFDTAPGTLVVDAAYTGRVSNDEDIVNLGALRRQLHGLTWKTAVTVATTSSADTTSYSYNAAAEGTGHEPLVWTGVTTAPVIDGVTLSDGDTILIKDAADPKGNGIFRYDAAAQGFRRVAEADNDPATSVSGNQMRGGVIVAVAQGTVNAGSVWMLTSPGGSVNLGTDLITFTLLSVAGAAAPTAGPGIAINYGSLPAGGQVLLDVANLAPTTNVADTDRLAVMDTAGAHFKVTRADFVFSNDVLASGASSMPAAWSLGLDSNNRIEFSAGATSFFAPLLDLRPSGSLAVTTGSGNVTVQTGGTGTVTVLTNDGDIHMTAAGTGNVIFDSAGDVAINANPASGGVNIDAKYVRFSPSEVRFTQDAATQTLTLESSRAGNTFVFGTVNTDPALDDAQLHLGTDRGLRIGGGATIARPSAPSGGVLRYNTDLNKLEYYDGTTWNSVGTVYNIDIVSTTDGVGVIGSPITSGGTINVFVKDDLASVEGLTTQGFVFRNDTATWGTRTLRGTTGRISIVNGDGLTGDPVIDLVDTGITPGVYTKLTVDASGRATFGEQAVLNDIANPNADYPFNFKRLMALADPIADDDAATKRYVDTTRPYGVVKAAVVAKDVATAESAGWTYDPAAEPNGLVWTGVGTSMVLDSQGINDGDRVLITMAADPRGNGVFVYDQANGGLRRAPDLDGSPGNEVIPGFYVKVVAGGWYHDTWWYLAGQTSSPLILGTAELQFSKHNARMYYKKVTAVTNGQSVFNAFFRPPTISKDSTFIWVDGVALDNDQFNLTVDILLIVDSAITSNIVPGSRIWARWIG